MNLLPSTQPGLSIYKKGTKNQIATSYNEIGSKINNKDLSKACVTSNNTKKNTSNSLKNSHITTRNNNKSLSKILKFQIKKPVQQISFIKPLQEKKNNSNMRRTINLSKHKISPIIKVDPKKLNLGGETTKNNRALSKPNTIMTFPITSRAQISFVGLNQNPMKLDEIKEVKDKRTSKILTKTCQVIISLQMTL